jgi:hypothetical protein
MRQGPDPGDRVHRSDRERVAAVTFDELRATHQSDAQLARALYDQLTQVEAMLALAEAYRDKLKKKLAPPPARRKHRGEN